ncbi:MAG TPA: GIY-YIG nuclease family protein [Patescibacteria group bacterium]|nr:GIY-YIG nuclease family protein [Patescibacteria group bacterium]
MSIECYVYNITNYANPVLYTGVTNDLQRRLYEHKSGKTLGFSVKYYLNRGLVSYCTGAGMNDCIFFVI